MDNDTITLLYKKQDSNTYLCRIDSTIPLADYRKRRSYYGRDMKVYVPDGNYQHFILSPSESAQIDVYDGGGEVRDGEIEFLASVDTITVTHNNVSDVSVSVQQEA